jgi:chemotaxis protein CheD
MSRPGGEPGGQSSNGTISVPIGGIAAACGGGVLRTFLGSCVGLVVYDRRLHVACLAHVVLPDSAGRGTPPGKYADTAVPAVLAELSRLTPGERLRPAAKLIGGAAMFAFQSGTPVGDQNVAAIERTLHHLGIPIVGRDCGGDRGRRMSLDVASGLVTIESIGSPSVTL